jgi:hypothetical protein
MTARSMLVRPLRLAYRELIGDRRDRITFWVLAGFLPTFVVARLLVHADPRLFVHIHGTHVHHFIWGIIVLAAVGFISIASERPARFWLAFFYGVGLALSFDEFGMWLRLTTNYNLDQSEDVMVGILTVLIVIVYVVDWLRRAYRYVRR